MIIALSNIDKERNLQKVDDFILDALDALSTMELGSQAYTQQQLHYFLSLRAARITQQPIGVSTSDIDQVSILEGDMLLAETDGNGHQHFSDILLDLESRSMDDHTTQPEGSIRTHPPQLESSRSDPSAEHSTRATKRRQDGHQVLERGGTLTVEVPRTVQIDLPDLHLELGLHSSTLSAHIYSSYSNVEKVEQDNSDRTISKVRQGQGLAGVTSS